MRTPRRKPTPLRILCYAVNGLGLGHLTRLVAIMREVRRLAHVLDMPAEIAFLTSSEGDSLAALHDFPAFKIPSRTVTAAAGFDAARVRKLSKQWVWNAVNLFAPDILVVDTFPAGAWNELHPVLDFGQRNVFVYRAVRPAQAAQTGFQSALLGYDLILKPGEGGEIGNDSPVPEGAADRVISLGTISLRGLSEMLTPEAARETLGLPAVDTCVYVSVGGGGDRDAAARYVTLLEVAARFPAAHFVFGAGALYTGAEPHAPNVRWTRRPLLATCFRAFDAAITAGGYNTVGELAQAGVPCVFVPQTRSHDDQGGRVNCFAIAGAGVVSADDTADAIIATLAALLEPGTLAAAADAARVLAGANAAPVAAAEILALVAPRDAVERAHELRDVWVDAGAALSGGWNETDFLRAVGLTSARLADGDAENAIGIVSRIIEVGGERGVPARDILAALRGTDGADAAATALVNDLLAESAEPLEREETEP